MEKSHFEQAKLWLQGAKYIANTEGEGADKYSVATAMLVHAILKANDALTTKILGKTAKRHDDAKDLFDEIIKGRKIGEEYASYRLIIQEAINNKSKAEYKVSFFSKNSYTDLERKAEKFVKMVEEYIK